MDFQYFCVLCWKHKLKLHKVSNVFILSNDIINLILGNDCSHNYLPNFLNFQEFFLLLLSSQNFSWYQGGCVFVCMCPCVHVISGLNHFFKFNLLLGLFSVKNGERNLVIFLFIKILYIFEQSCSSVALPLGSKHQSGDAL